MANLLNQQLKALAHPGRLKLLRLLKDPAANFPPQVHGDPVKDGVCSVFIARKFGVAAPTATRHLQVMTAARLLTATRRKQWTFYRRNEAAIRELKTALGEEL
jgi:ArsR family transcriptional regulator